VSKAQPSRLPWCGECDESSRLVDLPDGKAGRCPRCHARVALARTGDKATARARRHARRVGLLDESCPACGERIVKSHRCHASSMDPRSPAHPASIREVRIAAAREEEEPLWPL